MRSFTLFVNFLKFFQKVIDFRRLRWYNGYRSREIDQIRSQMEDMKMENRTETAIMLIKFYNFTAGTAFRSSKEHNQALVLEALDKMDGNVAMLKEHIREYVKANPDNRFDECFLDVKGQKVEVKEEPKEEPKAIEVVPTQVTDQQVQYSMGILEQAVIGLISKTQADRIESEIMGSVESKVRDFIKSEYGTIERKIVTVVDGKKVPMQGIQHEKFETVLKFVANDEPVFLTGPAGSGKNVLCKQVAEALGLKFYFTNAVTQEYKLTGFTDAMGTYQPTQFYKAFTEGGVFMLDEMDASIPEVLVILNAAIANRYFDFPAPIGYVEAHPDFRVIAAGNTTGHGADIEYVGRNQLDAASLDRFAVVKIDYSDAIEQSVVQGNVELLDFCRDFRKSANKAGLNIVVSYRAIGRLAKMVNLLTDEEAIDTCLVKGLDKDDMKIIENGLTKNNKYRVAFRRLVEAA